MSGPRSADFHALRHTYLTLGGRARIDLRTLPWTGRVLAGFEAERQALVLMDHLNIARVLDGGTSDSGRPAFVMDGRKESPELRRRKRLASSPAASTIHSSVGPCDWFNRVGHAHDTAHAAQPLAPGRR